MYGSSIGLSTLKIIVLAPRSTSWTRTCLTFLLPDSIWGSKRDMYYRYNKSCIHVLPYLWPSSNCLYSGWGTSATYSTQCWWFSSGECLLQDRKWPETSGTLWSASVSSSSPISAHPALWLNKSSSLPQSSSSHLQTGTSGSVRPLIKDSCFLLTVNTHVWAAIDWRRWMN